VDVVSHDGVLQLSAGLYIHLHNSVWLLDGSTAKTCSNKPEAAVKHVCSFGSCWDGTHRTPQLLCIPVP
jgi:hypothetical protein